MSSNRFKEQLRQQLRFIENSCEAYDRGQVEEAIRIGTSLRVLLHDTKRSTSLLAHLGAKQVPVLSTCRVPESTGRRQVIAFDGLAGFSGQGIRAKLGQGSTAVAMPAEAWWQQLVIGLDAGRTLTRAMIALTAANKDGGAHVDDELPAEYVQLIEGVWVVDGGKAVADHHLVYLRQMGYEVLNSPELGAIAS